MSAWWDPRDERDPEKLVERLGVPPRQVRSHRGEIGRRALLFALWALFSLVVYVGLYRLHDARNVVSLLYEHGQKTTAQVIKKEIERTHKRTSYVVRYRFEVDSKTYDDNWYLKEPEWQRVNSKTVVVTYAVSDPRINIVGNVRGRTPPTMGLTGWIGLLLGLAVAASVTVAFFGKELATWQARRVVRRWRAEARDDGVSFVDPNNDARITSLEDLQPVQIRQRS